MKLIFLHGLGQSPDDWQQVINELPISDTFSVELFSGIFQRDSVNLHVLNHKINTILAEVKEPFVLCGLSLGAVLALQQAIMKSPFLKGIVVSAPQFESPNTLLMTIQNIVFHFMPKKSFQNLGLTKKQLIELVNSMKSLNLKEEIHTVTIPTLILCGSKDRVNLSAAKELSSIMGNATLKIISNGSHELNRDRPKEFAKALEEFMHVHILTNE